MTRRKKILIALAVLAGLPVAAALGLATCGHFALQSALKEWEAVGGRIDPKANEPSPFTEEDYRLCDEWLALEKSIELTDGEYGKVKEPWKYENVDDAYLKAKPLIDFLHSHHTRLVCDEIYSHDTFGGDMSRKERTQSYYSIGRRLLGKWMLFDSHARKSNSALGDPIESIRIIQSAFPNKLTRESFINYLSQVALIRSLFRYSENILSQDVEDSSSTITYFKDLSFHDSLPEIVVEEGDQYARALLNPGNGGSMTDELIHGSVRDLIVARRLNGGLRQIQTLDNPLRSGRVYCFDSDEAESSCLENYWFLLSIYKQAWEQDTPMLCSFLDNFYDTRARILLMQTAARVVEFHAQHSAFPETFDTPADPFDGQPLRYRREGAGFVLWSVGPTDAEPIEWKWEGKPPEGPPAP